MCCGCIVAFMLWEIKTLGTPVKQITFCILSISQAISRRGACLQTYMVQMPPFISPFSVCQSVVHRLLAVTPVSAWLKQMQDRPQANAINILPNVKEAPSDSPWVSKRWVCTAVSVASLCFVKMKKQKHLHTRYPVMLITPAQESPNVAEETWLRSKRHRLLTSRIKWQQ